MGGGVCCVVCEGWWEGVLVSWFVTVVDRRECLWLGL